MSKASCQAPFLLPPLEMATEKLTLAEMAPHSCGAQLASQLASVAGDSLEIVGGIHPSTAFVLFQTLVSSPKLSSFWEIMDTRRLLGALALFKTLVKHFYQRIDRWNIVSAWHI